MKKIIRYTTEALADGQKQDILDLEAEIVELKRRLLDADDVEKEQINQDIEDAKQEMDDIKADGEEG